MTPIDWGVLAVLVAIFVPHAMFALRYGPSRPWWKTVEGRSLLFSATAWSLVSAGFIVDFWRDVPDWFWLLPGSVAALSGWTKYGMLRASDRERKP